MAIDGVWRLKVVCVVAELQIQMTIGDEALARCLARRRHRQRDDLRCLGVDDGIRGIRLIVTDLGALLRTALVRGRRLRHLRLRCLRGRQRLRGGRGVAGVGCGLRERVVGIGICGGGQCGEGEGAIDRGSDSGLLQAEFC